MGERTVNDPVAFLHEASRTLGASTDTHELADLTCQLVQRLLGADAVEVQLAESSFRCGDAATGPADDPSSRRQ